MLTYWPMCVLSVSCPAEPINAVIDVKWNKIILARLQRWSGLAPSLVAVRSLIRSSVPLMIAEWEGPGGGVASAAPVVVFQLFSFSWASACSTATLASSMVQLGWCWRYKPTTLSMARSRASSLPASVS